MTRTLSILLLLVVGLTSGFGRAFAGESELLAVYDVSALLGTDTAVVEATIRAEFPVEERLIWLATLVQAREEQRVLRDDPESGRGLTGLELARWFEILTHAEATPLSRLRPAGRGLCVSGPRALHEQVVRRIDALRTALWTRHRFEILLISATPAQLAELVPAGSRCRVGNSGQSGLRLSAEAATAFLQRLAANREILERGRGAMNMGWGEEVRFGQVREISHAEAVESQLAFGRTFGLPRPGKIEDGVRIHARVESAAGQSVRLRADLETALLVGLERFQVPGGAVEVPSLLSRSAVLDEALEPGALIGLLGLHDAFALTGAVRGERVRGCETQLAVLFRYLGRQQLPASPPASELFAGEAEAAERVSFEPMPDAPCVDEVYDATDIAPAGAKDFAIRDGAAATTASGKEGNDPKPLVGMIRACVAPLYWNTTGMGTVDEIRPGLLTVHAPVCVQLALKALLKDLRAMESTMIQIRVQVIGGRVHDGAPRLGHLLPALVADKSAEPMDFVKRVQAAFQDDADVRLITAPTLTTFQGQQAVIMIANQVAYLQDHELLDNAPGVVLNPVIGTVQEGILLQVRAHVMRGGEYLRVSGRVEIATIEKPIQRETFHVPSGSRRDGTEVNLELPTVRRLVHSFTEVVPRGENLLVALPGFVENLFGRDPGRGVREEVYLVLRPSGADQGKPPVTDNAGSSAQQPK